MDHLSLITAFNNRVGAEPSSTPIPAPLFPSSIREDLGMLATRASHVKQKGAGSAWTPNERPVLRPSGTSGPGRSTPLCRQLERWTAEHEPCGSSRATDSAWKSAGHDCWPELLRTAGPGRGPRHAARIHCLEQRLKILPAVEDLSADLWHRC
jgi:hypothetical protein